ncbi:MAG: helix-turn-helix domain-containing protein [Candidatus Gorgyraea atricola]|nr:helix-turn-helix domain-containing protein [Candidatus Gorgyraea atricola]
MQTSKKLISILILIAILTHQPIYAQSLRNPLCGGSDRFGKVYLELSAYDDRIAVHLLKVIASANMTNGEFSEDEFEKALNLFYRDNYNDARHNDPNHKHYLKHGIEVGILVALPSKKYIVTEPAKQLIIAHQNSNTFFRLLLNVDYLNTVKLFTLIGEKERSFSRKQVFDICSRIDGDYAFKNETRLKSFLQQAKDVGHIIRIEHGLYRCSPELIKLTEAKLPLRGILDFEKLEQHRHIIDRVFNGQDDYLVQDKDQDSYLIQVLDLLHKNEKWLGFSEICEGIFGKSNGSIASGRREELKQALYLLVDKLEIISERHFGYDGLKYSLDKRVKEKCSYLKDVLSNYSTGDLMRSKERLLEAYVALGSIIGIKKNSTLTSMAEDAKKLYTILYLILRFYCKEGFLEAYNRTFKAEMEKTKTRELKGILEYLEDVENMDGVEIKIFSEIKQKLHIKEPPKGNSEITNINRDKEEIKKEITQLVFVKMEELLKISNQENNVDWIAFCRWMAERMGTHGSILARIDKNLKNKTMLKNPFTEESILLNLNDQTIKKLSKEKITTRLMSRLELLNTSPKRVKLHIDLIKALLHHASESHMKRYLKDIVKFESQNISKLQWYAKLLRLFIEGNISFDESFEREAILYYLAQTDWHIRKAADLSGIPLRTLHMRIKRHKLNQLIKDNKDELYRTKLIREYRSSGCNVTKTAIAMHLARRTVRKLLVKYDIRDKLDKEAKERKKKGEEEEKEKLILAIKDGDKKISLSTSKYKLRKYNLKTLFLQKCIEKGGGNIIKTASLAGYSEKGVINLRTVLREHKLLSYFEQLEEEWLRSLVLSVDMQKEAWLMSGLKLSYFDKRLRDYNLTRKCL